MLKNVFIIQTVTHMLYSVSHQIRSGTICDNYLLGCDFCNGIVIVYKTKNTLLQLTQTMAALAGAEHEYTLAITWPEYLHLHTRTHTLRIITIWFRIHQENEWWHASSLLHNRAKMCACSSAAPTITTTIDPKRKSAPAHNIHFEWDLLEKQSTVFCCCWMCSRSPQTPIRFSCNREGSFDILRYYKYSILRMHVWHFQSLCPDDDINVDVGEEVEH